MRRIAKVSLILAALWLSVTACTETKEESLDGFFKESFDLWMAQHYPNVPKLESGLYMEWITKNPNGKRLNEGYWMKLNYTGRTIEGNIYTSRNKDIAKQMGYYHSATYFSPEYLQYSTGGSSDGYGLYADLTIGQMEALSMMREGDSVRLYTPYNMGYMYGFSGNIGFYSTASNAITAPVNKPLIIEMGLRAVVADPVAEERSIVEKYIVKNLGLKDFSDSIALGTYMKKLVALPQGDTIGADSTISIHYTTRFLDGFLVDTNIDSVARADNRYNEVYSSKYKAWSTTAGAEGITAGFKNALLKMRYGEKSVVVVTSSMAYGTGHDAAEANDEHDQTTAIAPYTPLLFEIYIEPHSKSSE